MKYWTNIVQYSQLMRLYELLLQKIEGKKTLIQTT
jgi:hypothetical protein